MGRAETGMWKRVVGYGALLAAGTLALQWLDYQRLARMHSGDVYLFLVAAAFLVLGIVLGVRVFAAPAPAAFDGNPKAQAALRLSERDLEVLHELVAGHSNKEIAAHLHISPRSWARSGNGKRCQGQFPPVLMSCRMAFGAAEFSLTPFLCRFGLASGARCYLRGAFMFLCPCPKGDAVWLPSGCTEVCQEARPAATRMGRNHDPVVARSRT
ncbi:hypothetical protein B0E48_08925 [Rhodanobacter sp. C03]|nr:hypothetical protein B0E48_08925 [Rhodanobacter sp. C03]